MYGVTKYFNTGEYELYGLLAGNDILLCPFDVPAGVTAIKQALHDELITEKEIDEHVERILNIKKKVCPSRQSSCTDTSDRIPTEKLTATWNIYREYTNPPLNQIAHCEHAALLHGLVCANSLERPMPK